MTLRSTRECFGWTQQELANAAGIYQPNLSWLERGKHKPTAATKKKIEAVVGPDVDWEATYLENKFNVQFKQMK